MIYNLAFDNDLKTSNHQGPWPYFSKTRIKIKGTDWLDKYFFNLYISHSLVGDNSEPYPDGMELWDTVTNTITKGLSMSSPNNCSHQIYQYFLTLNDAGFLVS